MLCDVVLCDVLLCEVVLCDVVLCDHKKVRLKRRSTTCYMWGVESPDRLSQVQILDFSNDIGCETMSLFILIVI